MSCGWNIITSVYENFTSSNPISGVGLSIQQCLTYSSQCGGYYGANCTSSTTIICGSMSPSTCSGTYGSDDYRFMYSVTTCSQKNIQQICSYYSDYCYYANNQCQQLTCANFTTPASCKFVISIFNIGEIQLCQWSTNTQNPLVLIYLHLQSLIQLMFSKYRIHLQMGSNNNLKQFNTQQKLVLYKFIGYTKFLMNIINILGQCTCNQLIYQYDCLTNPQCSWSTAITTPSCYNKPCNQIIQQGILQFKFKMLLVSNLKFMQVIFIMFKSRMCQFQRMCQLFNLLCRNIKNIFTILIKVYLHTNIKSMFSYTFLRNCRRKNKTIMFFWFYKHDDFSQIRINNQQNKSQIRTESIIFVNITQITKNVLKLLCVQILQLNSNVNNLIMFVFSFGNQPMRTTATASCVAASCNNFPNKQQCTYILNSLSATNVTLCQWQTIGVCIESTNTKNLSSTNCYSNTLMISRWSSTQTNSGFCATCSSYSQSQTYKSPCSCNELSQQECLLTQHKHYKLIKQLNMNLDILVNLIQVLSNLNILNHIFSMLLNDFKMNWLLILT
ncbi:unnamed protein product [Paramecium pentaurelia]|uniref:Uncharacterized protein n=1 Tax=Paramecium pentaurelia TaxID=43138 RepID=A0A8S1WL34_9CILI|nr:unnamed protein product [Paramecium pentaurelia]